MWICCYNPVSFFLLCIPAFIYMVFYKTIFDFRLSWLPPYYLCDFEIHVRFSHYVMKIICTYFVKLSVITYNSLEIVIHIGINVQ